MLLPQHGIVQCILSASCFCTQLPSLFKCLLQAATLVDYAKLEALTAALHSRYLCSFILRPCTHTACLRQAACSQLGCSARHASASTEKGHAPSACL